MFLKPPFRFLRRPGKTAPATKPPPKWKIPRTWSVNEIATPSLMNTYLRDNLLETMPAKAVAKGDLFVGIDVYTVERLPVGPNGKVLIADPSQALGVKWEDIGGSVVAQRAHYQTGISSFGSAGIPYDNTIPQQTEGRELFTLSITPQIATNILYIDISIFAALGATPRPMIIALFQDTISDALAVAAQHVGFGLHPLKLRHKMVAGTISLTAFKVRGGAYLGTQFYLNSTDTSDKFGGQLASSITITEVIP